MAKQENQNKRQGRDLGCTYMVENLFSIEFGAPEYMVNDGQTQLIQHKNQKS